MQQNSQALSLDMSKKGASDEIVPNSSLLDSYDADWQNLLFEHHRQPALEIPEVVFKQHILVISLTDCKSEFRMGDHYVSKTAQKGDLVLIPAQANYWNVDRTDNEFIVLSLEPQHLLHNNQELITSDNFELLPTFAEPDPYVYGTALALQQELITNYHGSHLYAESLLSSLGVHLLSKYTNKKPQIKQYGDGLPPYKLKQAIEYINDNLDRPIKLTDIAKLIDISQYYFCRLFHDSVGLSPYQYVIRQRVARARDLIKNSKLPLADISYECGFSSQSQMTQHFRKVVGVTPKVYRNKL